MQLGKSEIVEKKFKLDDKKEVILNKIEIEGLKTIKIGYFERLGYNIKEKVNKTILGSKLASKVINLIIGVRMDNSPVTTKFGNKAFWIKVIGILLTLLGFLGIDFSLEPETIEQIALFISAGVTLALGFFFDKKTAEATKDDDIQK